MPVARGLHVSSLARGSLSEDVGQNVLKKCQKALEEPLDEKRFETLKMTSAGNGGDRLEAVRRHTRKRLDHQLPIEIAWLEVPSQEFRVSCQRLLGLTSQQQSKAVLKAGVAMHGRHHAVQECVLGLCK